MSSAGAPMPGLEKQRLLERVAQNGDALRDAAAELQADMEIVATAVAQHGGALRCAAAELQADKGIVATAVAQKGDALQYAAAELQADWEIVATAVAQDGGALGYAAVEVKRDPALRQLRALNPQASAPLLAAQLRLRLAHALTCKEWLDGNDAGTCLSLEVVELIGQHCTCTVAVLGLLRPPSEGVPPSA
jgi:acetylornithine/succinyldiaminopimelate/putrescine aminotransferase